MNFEILRWEVFIRPHNGLMNRAFGTEALNAEAVV